MSYGDRHQAGNLVKGRATSVTTAVTELIPAPGGGYKLMIGTVVVCNRSATPTVVKLLSGSTVIWSMPAPATYGGSVLAFPDPLDCDDNASFSFQTEDNADVTVSTNGFRSKI